MHSQWHSSFQPSPLRQVFFVMALIKHCQSVANASIFKVLTKSSEFSENPLPDGVLFVVLLQGVNQHF